MNREKISDLAASLPKKITRITEQAAQRIQVVEKHVSILDPKNILKRGYSITRFEGNVISNKEALKNGMNIETELFDFNINSTIENVE